MKKKWGYHLTRGSGKPSKSEGVGRNSGGVCLYIRNDIKYKLRTDLCRANSNFESCFIEIENNNCRNILVGVIYRAHTSIDIFNTDVNHVLQILSKENKINTTCLATSI